MKIAGTGRATRQRGGPAAGPPLDRRQSPRRGLRWQQVSVASVIAIIGELRTFRALKR
jgi:hypothetical protein